MSRSHSTSSLRPFLFALGFAALGALAAMGGQAAAGAGKGAGKGHGASQALQELFADMDLTDDQKADLYDLRDKVRDQKRAQRAERRELLAELSDLVDQPKLDGKAVHAKVDARIDAKRAAAHEIADLVIDFHASLDDDQRAELAGRIDTLAQKVESRDAPE